MTGPETCRLPNHFCKRIKCPMKYYICLLSLLAFALFSSCKSKQPAQGISCTQKGTFVDMKGLDGCTFLIELADGRKLLPMFEEEPTFVIKDGLNVRLDFTEAKDGVSICMAEDLIANITCIQLMKE